MEVKLLNKDKKTGQTMFLIKDATVSNINALRRVIINDVPTIAIEEVELRKNNSVLYDEILAHRLGSIPMKTDLKSYELIKEGEALSAKNSVKMTLKFSARSDQMVLASEIKSADPKVVPVYPEMPIVKLLKGQQLEFEATAVMGRGRDHMKWSPGVVWFSYYPELTVNNKSPKLKEFKDKYPPQAFNKKGELDKELILQNNVFDACDGVCDDIVKVDYKDTDFIFYIEPFGQLTAKQMVEKAAEILDEKYTELEEQLSK